MHHCLARAKKPERAILNWFLSERGSAAHHLGHQFNCQPLVPVSDYAIEARPLKAEHAKTAAREQRAAVSTELENLF